MPCTSEPQMADTRTRISIWPSLGSGMRASMTSIRLLPAKRSDFILRLLGLWVCVGPVHCG
jgi:hypothetical protein